MNQEQPSTASPPPVTDRPLRRSSDGRIIAGVAAGIAHRLDIPAWVVRVAFIVLCFAGGLGFALYLAGWLLLPLDDETTTPIRRALDQIHDGSGWLGVALIGIGVLVAASAIDFIRGDLAIAVFLGVVGVLLYRGELGSGGRSTKGGADGETAQTESDATPRSAPITAPPTTASTLVEADEPVASDDEGGTTLPPPPAAPPLAVEPPAPRTPPPPPSILGRLTIALALIAGGVMAFLDWSMTTFDPTPRHYIGLGLGIIGLALVVGAWVGRARGLIFLGIVLVPALAFAPLAELDFGAGIGERRIVAVTIDDIQPSYELAIGQMILDLRSVELGGETVEVTAGMGIGSLRILVPDDVGLSTTSRVGIGEVTALGTRRGGFSRQLRMTREGDGLLVIDAETLIGEVDIVSSSMSGAGAVASGSVEQRIATPADLATSYELASGDLTLDMSDLVLRTPRTVDVSVGLGEITVIVPDEATTQVFAHTDFGSIDLFGIDQAGIDVDATSNATGRALLTLNIDIDSGQIVVEEG